MRALASHPHVLVSNPVVNAICGLSLLSVLSLALRGFSLGIPVFPKTAQKSTFLPNSNSTKNHLVDVLLLNIVFNLFCFFKCDQLPTVKKKCE